MEILKLVVFIFSCMGYYIHIKRKTELKEEFIPIVLISGITVIVFLGGILNFLKVTAYILGIIGVILLFKNLYLIIKNKEKLDFNKNILILGLLFVWAAWILKGVILTHYDNFSHWAMIIREMISENRLPNFESTTILFTSYPPGTACFVYFVCKYLGGSEAIMLFAQSIIILSSLYALFAFADRKNKVNYIIAFITIIYTLITNIFINQLLVDTVLPAMGIAALALILYYKDEPKKGLIYSIPIFTMLILVKNSGVFFIIIDILVWLKIFIKNNGFKALFKTKYLLLVLVPVCALLIWNAHTDIVFESADTAKHSMSVENYLINLENKEDSDFPLIISQMKERMISLKDIDNQILIICIVAYFVMIIASFKNKESRKEIIGMLITFVLTYVLYQISLFAMYVFSMPPYEARHLAAYTRYFRTMVVFNVGITCITMIRFLERFEFNKISKQYIAKIVLIILICIPVWLNKNSLVLLYKNTSGGNESRNIILSYKNTHSIEEQKSYLIYLSDNTEFNPDYMYYICKYDFRSKDVKVIKNFSELENMDKVFDYDYFIMLEKDESTNEFLNIIKGDLEADVIRFR